MMRAHPQKANRKKVNKESYTNLLKSLKPYIIPILIAMIFVITSVVIAILAPQVLKDLTNEMQSGSTTGSIDLNKIWNLAIIMIIMYFVNALMAFLSGMIMTVVTQKYGYSLRKDIINKINRMPLRYFDKNPYGDTLSRVTNDVDTISQSLQQSITMLLQSVVMLIGVLIAMFISNWIMALTVLATLPLAILQTAFVTKLAIPHFKERQRSTGKVNAIVEENFSGALIIK